MTLQELVLESVRAAYEGIVVAATAADMPQGPDGNLFVSIAYRAGLDPSLPDVRRAVRTEVMRLREDMKRAEKREEVKLFSREPTHVLVSSENGFVHATFRYAGKDGPSPRLGIDGVVAIDYANRFYTTSDGKRHTWDEYRKDGGQ